jgi:hypothetical protein
MPRKQQFEIILFLLETMRLPRHLFGTCQLDFGFLWRSRQRAFKIFVAQPKRLWLDSQPTANG